MVSADQYSSIRANDSVPMITVDELRQIITNLSNNLHYLARIVIEGAITPSHISYLMFEAEVNVEKCTNVFMNIYNTYTFVKVHASNYAIDTDLYNTICAISTILTCSENWRPIDWEGNGNLSVSCCRNYRNYLAGKPNPSVIERETINAFDTALAFHSVQMQLPESMRARGALYWGIE
jgi:hypothetical protein